MLSYPGFDPVAVALGPLKVRWYGLMYVVGFLSAWWLARRYAARPGSTWTAGEVDDLIFYAVFGVILGGRIGWLIFYGQEALAADPGYWYKIWLGGMSFHGGFAGVIIVEARKELMGAIPRAAPARRVEQLATARGGLPRGKC